jgi:hypothetical protein
MRDGMDERMKGKGRRNKEKKNGKKSKRRMR